MLKGDAFQDTTCSTKSCSCKAITLLTIINSLEAQYSNPLKCYREPEECLLAFLQSHNASVAVGHWLSHLLQVIGTLLLAIVHCFFLFAIYFQLIH